MKTSTDSIPQNDSWFNAGAGRLKEMLADWRERSALRCELAALTPDERAKMLADIGLQEADLPAVIDRAVEVRTLLPAMLKKFDLTESLIAGMKGPVLQDMQRVCAACTTRAQCRKALAAGADAAECRTFCPNADTMDAAADTPSSAP